MATAQGFWKRMFGLQHEVASIAMPIARVPVPPPVALEPEPVAPEPVIEAKPTVCVDPANQLFFLIALPKSAGQALRRMLNLCRVAGPQPDFIPDALACPRNLHVEMPLTDRILTDFPEGGWHHTHAPATLMTLDFLSRHRIRHVVQFRHPLDQLASYYCHLVKHSGLGHAPATSWRSDLMLTNPLAPVPVVALQAGMSQDRSFELFIEYGYFVAVLDWIGQWLAFRSAELSLVITYENLVADPRRELLRAIDFLQPMLGVPDAGIDEAVGEMDGYVRFSRALENGLDTAAYPRGYTGHIGVHRDYLSPRLIERARALYEQYCRESVYGPHLREYYPTI